MREKKYIDRLYQEKFRDFEAAPREAVWKSIAAKLQEEEKKPLATPLWTRLAGVAAIFTFLLLIGEWILPVQKGPGVANEKTNETLQSPSSLPVNSSLAIVPLEVEPSTETKILKDAESVSANAGQNKRNTELLTSKMNSQNAIFGTQVLVASNELKAEKESLPIIEKRSLLEEIMIEEEETTDIVTNTSKTKFEISTHAAPIYYGNLGKGNFLDPRFNNNSSEGDVTYSYGINLAYNISNKIKVRSGVNKVSMSYTTNGVAYQAVAGTAPLKSVSLETDAPVTPVAVGTASGRQPSGNTNRSNVGFLIPGDLNQKMGFIEVPVELEYNLFAKKFELNIIGGASTLFLENNEVSLNSSSISAEGKANNINNISFSTNIGLGLDFNISDKFKLNLEPMLKYQINTFESPTEDSKPYYLGVYSGFSYKF